MKKILLTLAVAGMTLGASAQEKGRFEVHDLGNFKLHVYYTNDALGDASYIIEGRKALVTAAKADAVQFKIGYLKKMKEVLGDSRTAQEFVDGMKKAYPELPGADGLGELAKALYK